MSKSDVSNLFKMAITLLEETKDNLNDIRIINTEIRKIYPTNKMSDSDYMELLQYRSDYNKLMREVKEMLLWIEKN